MSMDVNARVLVPAAGATPQPVEVDVAALAKPRERFVPGSTPAPEAPSAPTAAATAQTRAVAADGLSEYRKSALARVKEAGTFDEARKIADGLDLSKPHSISRFGMDAQSAVSTQAEAMLQGVRANELGPVSDVLVQMTGQMRGFPLEVTEKARALNNFWQSAKTRMKAAINEFKVRSQDVTETLDKTNDQLKESQHQLASRIAELDVMFDASVGALSAFDTHIVAGTLAIEKLDTEIIPALEKKVGDGSNPVTVQELADARGTRKALDERVAELVKAHTSTGQDLVAIRVMQDANDGLVRQIDTIRSITLGQFKKMLAIALVLNEQKFIADSGKAVIDTGNDLMRKVANQLRTQAIDVETALANGVTSFEALQYVHEAIVDTVNQTRAIAEEAKAARREVENRLDANQKALGELAKA